MTKILPPQLFLLFAIGMGLVCSYFEFAHYIEFPFNLAGLPLLVGGILLAQTNKNLFRRMQTNIDTFAVPDKLVTAGVYRYSRNPMYLGLVMALTGIAILYQGSVSSLFLLTIFVIVTHQWYIKYEEKMLTATFGQEYLAYCRRTRRWV